MQAKMLNIPTYIEDPSYRYKMPGLILKIEGRGNGIKTKIVNLNEIAQALRVPPAYPLKFLGYELGSQVNENQQIVNGSFAEPEMRKHLDKFIEKYVCCQNCKYPEMVIKIKHGSVGGACNSCGTRGPLDNTHKLAAYILKNPPSNSSEFKDNKPKEAGKKDKDDKKDKDAKGKHADKDTHADKKTEESKHEEEKKEKHSEKHVEKVSKDVSTTVTFKDLEDDLINKVKQIYQSVAKTENFEENSDAVKKIIQGAKEVVPEEHKNKIPYVIFNAIFDVNIAKQVTKNKIIITQAYSDLGVKDQELDTLLNLEKFLLVRNAAYGFETYVATILKLFYDEDLLSEEFLIDWDSGKYNSRLIMDFRYQKPVDERFKTNSKPIIDWLKAEEGDEEEGEKEGGDDSDIDIDNI